MGLLAVNQDAKTSKGVAAGYLTGILYLSPGTTCGVNVCPMADACKAACLNTAGRGAFRSVQRARRAKTRRYLRHRFAFELELERDIRALVRQAKRRGLTPAVRINGTSDLPGLARTMARRFPDVQFYDYTKLPQPWKRTLPNYHLTFSRDSAANEADCLAALLNGVNASVVFDTPKGQALPQTWWGFPVVDGDKNDLRFLDGTSVVVGLRAKGRAKRVRNGFVVNA